MRKNSQGTAARLTFSSADEAISAALRHKRTRAVLLAEYGPDGLLEIVESMLRLRLQRAKREELTCDWLAGEFSAVHSYWSYWLRHNLPFEYRGDRDEIESLLNSWTFEAIEAFDLEKQIPFAKFLAVHLRMRAVNHQQKCWTRSAGFKAFAKRPLPKNHDAFAEHVTPDRLAASRELLDSLSPPSRRVFERLQAHGDDVILELHSGHVYEKLGRRGFTRKEIETLRIEVRNRFSRYMFS